MIFNSVVMAGQERLSSGFLKSEYGYTGQVLYLSPDSEDGYKIEQITNVGVHISAKLGSIVCVQAMALEQNTGCSYIEFGSGEYNFLITDSEFEITIA